MTPRTATLIIASLAAVIVAEIAYLTAPVAGQLTARVFNREPAAGAGIECIEQVSACRNQCQTVFDADPSRLPEGCYEACEAAFQSCRGDGG